MLLRRVRADASAKPEPAGRRDFRSTIRTAPPVTTSDDFLKVLSELLRLFDKED